MAKLVKCKSCGAEIAKNAKTCPQCGAKNKRHTALGIILVVIGVLLVLIALGGNGGEPKKVEDNNNTNTVENSTTTSPMPQPDVFSIGDKVALNDIVVTLTDVSENNGSNYVTPSDGKVFVVCEFEIENNSSKDIAVSSIMSFEAYVDDYTTNMSLSATLSTDKTQLDGTIAAGKKMNGVIGYEVDSEWSAIEIRFTPDFWAGKNITFIAGSSSAEATSA